MSKKRTLLSMIDDIKRRFYQNFPLKNPRLHRQRDESGFCFSFPDDGKDSYKFP